MLQSPQMDIFKVQQHIRLLTETIGEHRANAEEVFRDLYSTTEATAGQLGAEISVPRMVARQMHRPNALGTPEEYHCRNIFIPYLDSLLSALEGTFGERNTPAFPLLLLHPNALRKLSNEDFKKQLCEPVNNYFDFDNFDCQVELWRRSWMKADFNGDLIDLLAFAEGIYPAISRALRTAITFPSTTCCPEHSFSTMRRVETWLHSKMSDDHLSELYMVSLHRQKIEKEGTKSFRGESCTTLCYARA
ncbi:hypothetical protein MTO96_032943 [Rhipicephalus appendiculatus]